MGPLVQRPAPTPQAPCPATECSITPLDALYRPRVHQLRETVRSGKSSRPMSHGENPDFAWERAALNLRATFKLPASMEISCANNASLLRTEWFSLLVP